MPAVEPTFFGALGAGTLRFDYGVPLWAFLLLAAALIALTSLGYRKTFRPLTPLWRRGLIAVRSAALVLIAFCMLRPVVVSTETVPQETFFAVLIDDSASMQLVDAAGGDTREAAALAALERDFLAELAEDFQLRYFAFSGTAQRLGEPSQLDALHGENGANGEGSDVRRSSSALGQALATVDDQLGGLPLSGVLVVSDGADNSGVDSQIAAREFAAKGVPIFALGIGETVLGNDLGIEGVVTAATVLEGSVFNAQVRLNQQGFAGQRVQLRVLEDGVEVAQREIVLGAADVTQRFELELTPSRDEAIVYELEAQLADPLQAQSEKILENNRYSFLVDNSPKPALDVLFIEGHPRNEYKFIQRAVRGDSSLRLATYLRTGPEKYYRQGIESPTELSDGFPASKDALFEYEAIILGDIEQEFFTAEQLQLLDDFVAERGGGLLLSGRVDEGFIGTPLADIAPVSLVEESLLPRSLQGGIRRGDHATGALFSPQLTQAGRVSPLLRLAGDDGANLSLWSSLPALQGIYVTGRTKPGATVLLQHPTLDYQNQPLPLVVSQRYGSGRSMSITTASTWRWQMMLPVADQTQEKLWRQLLRWLAVGAQERIELSFDRDFYHLGDTVTVEAKIVDADYEADNEASLWLQREDPLGGLSDTPMQWQLNEEGVYQAQFVAQQEGVHQLLVEVASAAGEGRAENTEKRASLVVTPSLREYTNAGLDEGVLQRLAETTGGAYQPLAGAGELAAAIRSTPTAYTKERVTDLWDSPWMLALLIGLLCLDWSLRRTKGLS